MGKIKIDTDIVIEGHDLKLQEGDAVHLFVTFKRDPFGIDCKIKVHEFGCDVKENTDTVPLLHPTHFGIIVISKVPMLRVIEKLV